MNSTKYLHEIEIKGAKVHNLKNVSLKLPRNKIIVITGVSGSGKSSLAFDTLYAEGQRRYVESLSSYARQFLGKIEKPDVESISGISPAVAIEQKVTTRNSRSTVGTTTEIYDYLKLLFARIGKTYSPISGNLVKKHSSKDILEELLKTKNDCQINLLAPLKKIANRTTEQQLSILSQQGFSRIVVNNEIKKLSEPIKISDKDEVFVMIDRIIMNHEEADEIVARLSDAIQTGYYEGEGALIAEIIENNKITRKEFSEKFELDGITFEDPSVHFFSFNNPVGACKTCEGLGSTIGIDPDLVIPNKSLSIYEEAIVCWKGEKMSKWKDDLINHAHKFNFPIHKPYFELSKEQKDILWTGNQYFYGLHQFFKYLEENTYKIQYRVMLSRYRGKTVCPDCQGTKLRKDAAFVKINEKSLIDLVLMPIDELAHFFSNIQLTEHEKTIAKRLLIEINNRLLFLKNVGLGYLTLNRAANTLSGGESQRINLATSLGSSLVGSTYILDEPSIGLHPKDTEKLISVITSLQQLGNTVIIVEHDEDIMKAAHQIVDIGPEAGRLGGEIVFQGSYSEMIDSGKSLTSLYLSGKESIPVPAYRRKWKDAIYLKGAREHNLNNVSVKFPLKTFTVVTGVSGSGKSTLVKKILFPALQKLTGGYGESGGKYDVIEGEHHKIKQIEFIDQNPIGRSSRSNPVTYVKAYDEIRQLYANHPLSKSRNYRPAFFSFNVDGGRCETCQGEGQITIEMQFMADIHLTCEACNGNRFKDEILDIQVNGKSIADLLKMTIDEAMDFFKSKPEDKTFEKIAEKLTPLQEVGLGYVALGQSSSSLSGGEAQRIKLATFLGKTTTPSTLFIFDEPTTGLHFHDIKKLLKALNALVDNGHSLIVIEHNQEVIKCADWVIDIGPEGGDKGGTIVFEGTPEELVKCAKSYTGKYLKEKL
jgi:excinuclease ABC subunit A